MNIRLNIDTNSFKTNIVIDPTAFIFRGMVESHNYGSTEKLCSISFRLPENADVDAVVEQIKNSFQLNDDYNIEDYFYVSSEDSLRMTVKFEEGAKGFRNAPYFSFTSIETLS